MQSGFQLAHEIVSLHDSIVLPRRTPFRSSGRRGSTRMQGRSDAQRRIQPGRLNRTLNVFTQEPPCIRFLPLRPSLQGDRRGRKSNGVRRCDRSISKAREPPARSRKAGSLRGRTGEAPAMPSMVVSTSCRRARSWPPPSCSTEPTGWPAWITRCLRLSTG